MSEARITLCGSRSHSLCDHLPTPSALLRPSLDFSFFLSSDLGMCRAKRSCRDLRTRPRKEQRRQAIILRLSGVVRFYEFTPFGFSGKWQAIGDAVQAIRILSGNDTDT